MTHAALKDLLDKWLDTEAALRVSGENDAANACSLCRQDLDAAISAMEGEVVGYMRRMTNDSGFQSKWEFVALDVEREPRIGRWNCEYRPLIYGDTAPPPQQAVSSGVQLQRWGRGPEPHPYLLQRLEDGYWTPWHIAQAAVNAATQPQQAGGDAPQHPVPQLWIDAGGMIARISETKYGLGISFNCDEAAKVFSDFYRATPPQPEAGGGVTEAMVEAGINKFWHEFPVEERDEEWIAWARQLMRETLEAALSTTHASGGEHG